MVINPVHCSLPFTCAGNYLAVPTWQTALLHSSFAPLPQMTLMLNGMVDRGFTLYPSSPKSAMPAAFLIHGFHKTASGKPSFSIWIALFLPSSSTYNNNMKACMLELIWRILAIRGWHECICCEKNLACQILASSLDTLRRARVAMLWKGSQRTGTPEAMLTAHARLP